MKIIDSGNDVPNAIKLRQPKLKKQIAELEKKIEGLEKDKTEVGWVDEEKIKKYGFPPAKDTMVLVCGLPAVYDKICGPRCSSSLPEYSALKNLGYSDEMVLKF